MTDSPQPTDKLERECQHQSLVVVSRPPNTKVCSDPYATPLGRATGSNTSAGAKKKLSQVATVPNRCLITLSQRPLNVCHVLRRATKKHHLWQLEEAWGLENGNLNLDSTGNLIYLTPDMHQMFDSGDWALIPKVDWLRDIGALLFRGKVARFEEIVGDGYDYTMVPLRGDIQPFLRHNLDGSYEINSFSSEPPQQVHSHIHPFFVVCNVAQKERHLRGMDEEHGTKPIGSRILHEDALDYCVQIYKTWLDPKKTPKLPLASTQPPPPLPSYPPSPSSHYSDKKSQQKLSRDERQLRREQQRLAKQLGLDNAPQTGGNIDSSEWLRVASGRPRAASLPTPEYTHSDVDKAQLFGDAGQPAEEPPDVSKWAAGVTSWFACVEPKNPDCMVVW